MKMNDYGIQIQRLMFVVNGQSLGKLNVYDIDGTLIPFSKKGKSIEQEPVRSPEQPFILLSARALQQKSFTRLWCDYNHLKPLAIFHRDIDKWSFEQGNISFYKPYIIRKIRSVMPNIELCMFDDDSIDPCVSAEITFNKLSRVIG